MTDDEERYLSACHAMQSGVAALMNIDATSTKPKHLRVGINSAMVSHAAIVKLLIDKGLFTEAEYMKVLADKMETEVNDYIHELSEVYGKDVKLS
jgi:hypothetical protein